MSQLNLIHLQPDLYRLLPWAQRQGLVSGKGQGDLGYAFHAALKAVFGDLSPQPFCYRHAQGLLAYTVHGEGLRSAAALAMPDLAAMLRLDATVHSPGLLIRPFPHTWQMGRLLAFELRMRPVIRTQDGRERDVFLAAIERQKEAAPSREAVYGDWLRRHLVGAADLLEYRMNEFKLSSVIRRGAPGSEGVRLKKPVSGPDAVFTGLLKVKESDAFADLIARGVGRHRAFGFGMLLLKPVAASWG